MKKFVISKDTIPGTGHASLYISKVIGEDFSEEIVYFTLRSISKGGMMLFSPYSEFKVDMSCFELIDKELEDWIFTFAVMKKENSKEVEILKSIEYIVQKTIQALKERMII